MKNNFKTTILIAAIGMIVYTIYVLTHYALSVLCPTPYHYDLWTDICERLIFDILPVSLILAGVGLWKNRPVPNASKPFRIFTVCLFVAMFGTLLFSPLYTVYIAGLEHIYPSIYWRALILVAGIVWLFMLRNQPLEEASPRSYLVTLIFAMLALAFPMVLEIASGISCICTGYVLCFASSSIKSWVRWIAPTLVFVHFVFPQIKAINTTRNSHCTPGSYDEGSFNRNRSITLVVVGLAILSCALCLIFVPAHEDYYIRHYHMGIYNDTKYQLLQMLSIISFCTLGISCIISWIMLSIMAFRQLPNPRGYKIFNVVCQVLAIGGLIAGVIVGICESTGSPSSAFDSLGFVFLWSVAAFVITTTIRVISYSLPKQLEQ